MVDAHTVTNVMKLPGDRDGATHYDDSLTNDSSSQLQSIDTTAYQWDGSLSIVTIPQSTAVQQSNITNGTVYYYDFCPSALYDDLLTNDSSSQLQSIDTTAHQWDGSLSIATIPQSTAVQQWCEPPFCIDAVTPLISMAPLSPDEAVWQSG
ncbi:hypothetical protein DAPPUDRAFT_321707 [Daphnia pulex]|uniref:Uncharacterized protein n=1 Tax=Daphnia pulex TaxID=6669 RepID=E9GTM9_DAPPU|nr:hypothetical protein DAPPUDRAFT_321707 [Daphnia pulex]|eukprot:EFX77183.1 hypothetical protein DAPPUDRAFT_321707 [Daphnia pulex]